MTRRNLKSKARWTIEQDGGFRLEWDPVKKRLTMRERCSRELMEVSGDELVQLVRGEWTLRL